MGGIVIFYFMYNFIRCIFRTAPCFNSFLTNVIDLVIKNRIILHACHR